jgi:hypothetical protein
MSSVMKEKRMHNAELDCSWWPHRVAQKEFLQMFKASFLCNILVEPF